MKLPGRMPVDMTVKASDTKARRGAFAVIRRVEFFLRKRRKQHLKPAKLHGCQDVLEKPVKIVDGDNFSTRNIAQLRPALKEYRRRKFRKERVGQIKVDIKPLQTGKHIDLHLRKNLSPCRLFRMRQRWIGKEVLAAYLLRGHARELLPAYPSG